MAHQFYALRHIGDRKGEPFGLLRVDGPFCQRYVPEDGSWAESPGDQDYLWGEEPGATRIDAAEADRLIARGKLVNVPADVLADGWERPSGDPHSGS
ncbi:MAG: hypothetical protein BGO26_16590 [Actinobacteria bacterium 69-20]|nr:hypothetical protein [Actinomycetota bacterium]OJV27895.1 MAG: hypothetical protein BGO26_16590 [Actinobacteria bacterium 69-20]